MIIGIHEQASTKTEENQEEPISERRLWSAVLLQALEDWRSPNVKRRAEAEKFLFSSSGDFEKVCRGAGLDMASVVSKLQKMKGTTGQAWRTLEQQAA